ncbi:hypothetical protein CCL17_07195 [Pseudomonas congelans]|nr:hypothetical protein CCL17_07195 [Pseudomonas congelans]
MARVRNAPARQDAERPERHPHAEHGYDQRSFRHSRSSRSSVGMPFVTLRVTQLCTTPHVQKSV